MVAYSPAISHWLLTNLFRVTGYNGLANPVATHGVETRLSIRPLRASPRIRDLRMRRSQGHEGRHGAISLGD